VADCLSSNNGFMTSLAHPLDIGIFVVFLVVTLVVGLRHGRSVKTLRDYALGGKNFSTSTLVATIVATWITGSFLTWRIGDIYHNGLYAVILYMCDIGTLVLTGWIFAMRMGPFLQNMSIAEAMGDVYGKPVRVITALFGLLVTIGLVGLQFKTGEKIFSALLGWDSVHTQTFIGVIIIFYSAFGGIRAVTFTDIFQFLTFGTLIPILALIIWNDMRDFNAVLNMLQEMPDFNIKVFLASSSTEKRWNFFTLIPLYLIPAFSPPIFQRATMAKNVYQARQAFLYSALIYFFLFLFIVWIAILIRTENNSLDPGYVFQYIVERYASVGMAGLLLAGLMAMIMSTADSNLNAAAVIFANDIIAPMMVARKYSLLKSVQSDGNQLFIARVGSIFIGLLSLLLALNSDSYLYVKIVLGAWGYYMPVVSVPLLLSILGFRSTTRAVLIGMTAGFTTVYLWDIFFAYTNIDNNVPGILANLTGLLGSHYLLGEQGGWQQLPSDSPIAIARILRKKAWQRRLQAMKSFRPYPYLLQNLPAQESFYFFFGLYTMAATYAALYTIGDVGHQNYQPIYTGIYHAVLPITTAFLTFPIWPPTVKSKRFITFFWPIGIGGILFFAGTLLVIVSHFHHMQVMIMVINLLMAVLLLRWPLALFLAFIGIALAVSFFTQYTGATLPLDALGSLQFRIMYGLLLLTSLLIALFKGKQAYRQLEMNNKNLVITNQETAGELLLAFQDKARFSQAFRKSGAPALIRLTILSREIREALQRFSLPQSVNQKINELNEQLAPIAMQLDRLDHRATSYLRLTVNHVHIDVLLAELQDRLCAKGIDKGIQVSKKTQQTTLRCDVERIKTLLINSITFLRNVVGEEQPILISIEDTQLGYPRPSVKKSYIKTIDSLSFTITTDQKSPKLEPYYLSHINGVTASIPQNTQELPLATNTRITEAHYGYIHTVVQDGSCTLLYVIPVDLREVRPEDMDDLCMELNTELTRADDTYPGAREQEQEFLEAVAKKTQADLDLVHKAIETIKYYHGVKTRKSGEPFYLHPIAVAQIVLDYNQEEATILGALLHDTVEDTPMLLENIEMMFNKEVAHIVDGVTNLDSNRETFYKLKLSAHENIRKLLEVVDKRALYVKLADRMHNMRTIQAKPYESQRRTAEEALLFFVPIAEKLGLINTAEELKELCFAVLNGKLEM
jgi:Na+/proline symporter